MTYVRVKPELSLSKKAFIPSATLLENYHIKSFDKQLLVKNIWVSYGS